MSGAEEEGWDEGAPERLYVVTGGRSRAGTESVRLDLVTLIVSRDVPQPGMPPEQTALLRMCHYPLSVAEISAYLVLPVSTVAVLLTDLLADGRMEARAPIPAAALPDAELLKAVMHGLQNL
ncbi:MULTISPECIES: DUF742 domain-containing protein [Streptomyces]|uniref:DUF742 domain-containing protein n=1 Tax=Streptomyces lycii TaxID=2654337 RepID=A0ABQ7FQT7_9ACTN|nr:MULTISPECIES: DUF742 domain-containing protein [Streptomyces]KAF4410810.1 DUF742 domain-containing protein [Streptomyces lycii]PGH51023.1 hypothetical protein CRI70_08985 [Streptomyces sp. Ru87]